MKKIRHLVETIILAFFLLIFKILPFKAASYLGHVLLTIIGPRLKFHRNASANLKIAFPNITHYEQEEILLGMWDNLGRSIGEFPHIFGLSQQNYNKLVKINNPENLDILENGGLIFSAHIGNWELVPYIFRNMKKKIFIVYRRSNNKIIDKIINYFRGLNHLHFIPKGQGGAKQIIRELKNKNIVIMLVDQRMRDGIEVDFFGKSAATAPAIASLALQYKLPIIPIYSVRTKNCNHNYEIFIDKPLKMQSNGSKTEIIYNTMSEINKTLETWIRKDPSQWFWIHNRWAKNKTH